MCLEEVDDGDAHVRVLVSEELEEGLHRVRFHEEVVEVGRGRNGVHLKRRLLTRRKAEKDKHTS